MLVYCIWIESGRKRGLMLFWAWTRGETYLAAAAELIKHAELKDYVELGGMILSIIVETGKDIDL